MAMTDFTIISRSMTGRLFSTITTIVTVAVAVGLMLVLLSMRNSAQQAFARGSGNMHMLVSRDASPLVAVLNGIFYADSPRNYMEWPKYIQIANNYPFEYAIPTQQGDSYRGLPVMATTTEFFEKFQPAVDSPWELEDGRFFQSPFEVVVGAEAARARGLGVGDALFLTHGASTESGDAVGMEDHVHTEYSYNVVGVLKPTGSAHDRALFTDLDSSWILHAHDRRKAELGHDIALTTIEDLEVQDKKITGIYTKVFSRPGMQGSAAMQPVFNALRADTSITVASPSNQIGQLFTIVSNIDKILIAMAGVVMISSAIAIMLALYNSMEQRRRQIAVLRVLGSSRGHIFELVVTESALLGLLGAIVGIGLAYGGGLAVAGAMKERLGLVIVPTMEPLVVAVICLATIALASIAGFVPAMMAYRTPVARNLRPLG